jgi:hypothetical protein
LHDPLVAWLVVSLTTPRETPMKVTYWIAECLNDSHAYSIRERTKKAVETELNSGRCNRADYGPVKKVIFEYSDAFDLVTQCLTEGGGYWEN